VEADFTESRLAGRRKHATKKAKVIEVIETETLEGAGNAENPCYIKRLYWSLDGELLAVGIFSGQ